MGAALKQSLLTIGLLLAMIGLGCLQARLASLTHVSKELQQGTGYWGVYANAPVIKRFLGTRIAAADLIWIDLAIKSDLEREMPGFSPFYKAIRTMLDLDPYNFYGAWFGALYLSVIKDDIKGASLLFEETIQSMEANTWLEPRLKGAIYFAYGYHLLYEEHDPSRATQFIIKSAGLPAASRLAKEMAESMATERGQIEVGFRVLNEAYRRAKDPAEKSRIEGKMTALLLRRELVDLNEQFSEYKARTEAQDMARNRAFQLFLRSINHSGKDTLGRRLTLDETGKVVPDESRH